MSVATLVLFAALTAAEPDPAALAAKLGSADPAERAFAASALEALGREALPALSDASKAADRDLRARASALWDTIQRGLMTRPTLVTLDFTDQPVANVFQNLAKQTGFTLASESSRGPYTIKNVPDPVSIPFWEAIKRLGLKSVYHHNPGGGKLPNLELRSQPTWTFTSTAGPFRVSLMGLHLHRDHQWIDGPWVRIDRFGQRIEVLREDRGGDATTFFGGLEVMAEPRMWFTQEAPARLTEATDDLGQSLVAGPADLATSFNDGAPFPVYSGSGVTEMRTEFRLKLPDHPGRSARLRGVVPLMLHLRRPEPTLVIPLADAVGKTFRCDDAEFTIRAVTHAPKATRVSMTGQLNIDKAELPDNPIPALIHSRLGVMNSHQLHLVDDQGTVLADSISGQSGMGENHAGFRWNMNTFQRGRATQLLYYGMLRVRADAAFDFRDVPLP